MVSALRPITRGRPRGPLPAPSTSSRVIARAPFRRDAARHNRPGRLASPSAASADSLDYRELLDCGTYEWQGYKIRSAVSPFVFFFFFDALVAAPGGPSDLLPGRWPRWWPGESSSCGA